MDFKWMVKPRHQFQVHAEATDPECFQEGKGKYINQMFVYEQLVI